MNETTRIKLMARASAYLEIAHEYEEFAAVTVQCIQELKKQFYYDSGSLKLPREIKSAEKFLHLYRTESARFRRIADAALNCIPLSPAIHLTDLGQILPSSFSELESSRAAPFMPDEKLLYNMGEGVLLRVTCVALSPDPRYSVYADKDVLEGHSPTEHTIDVRASKLMRRPADYDYNPEASK